MRILLTGGSGFIGSHLARLLDERGDEVHFVLRPSSSFPRVRGHRHIYDGTMKSAVKALERARPDVLVHAAATIVAQHGCEDVDTLIDVNVRFPAHLFEAMKTIGCSRAVIIGSFWQHATGRDIYEPANLYAATKQACADLLLHYVRSDGFKAVELILCDSYGPNDTRGKLLPHLLRAVQSREHLSMSAGEQEIDLLHVRDVAEAILVAIARTLAEETPSLKQFMVRSNAPITLRDLVETMQQLTGRALNIGWGERPYRPREVMTIWRGPTLPDWEAKIELKRGLAELLTESAR